jgi:hypothetical protein
MTFAQADMEPDDADLRGDQVLRGRLQHERRIGGVASGNAGERAVAGGFLVDHRLDMDAPERIEPGLADRLDPEQPGQQPGLHVAAAAAIELAVGDAWLEGRRGPVLGIAGRDDIDMPVQDQRPAAAAAGVQGADHVEGLVVVEHGRAIARHVLQLGSGEGPSVDIVATGAELGGHDLLGQRLAAAEGRRGDEALRDLDLLVEGRVDRSENGRPYVLVHDRLSCC